MTRPLTSRPFRPLHSGRLLGVALALLPLAASAATAPEPARVAPGAQCLDARGIRDMHQARADSVIVLDASYQPWRLRFAQDCPGVPAAAQAVLEAPSGWACGGKDERVRVDAQVCPIAAVERISARDFALEAKLSDAQALPTLPAIEVAAASETAARFRGSPSYCFSARHLRSWSEDPGGVLVETNPRHSGGNRFYRVELGTRCPELGNSPEIAFQSGFSNGLICGNYGDRLVATPEIPGDLRRVSNPRNYLGCAVIAVYPVR